MDKYKTAYGTGIIIDAIEIFHNIMMHWKLFTLMTHHTMILKYIYAQSTEIDKSESKIPFKA